jgi:hypothetical protein
MSMARSTFWLSSEVSGYRTALCIGSTPRHTRCSSLYHSACRKAATTSWMPTGCHPATPHHSSPAALRDLSGKGRAPSGGPAHRPGLEGSRSTGASGCWCLIREAAASRRCCSNGHSSPDPSPTSFSSPPASLPPPPSPDIPPDISLMREKMQGFDLCRCCGAAPTPCRRSSINAACAPIGTLFHTIDVEPGASGIGLSELRCDP